MVLSRDEINDYITQYYSLVVIDPERRAELVSLAQSITSDNVERFGLPTSAILHNTLEEILDRHKSRWDLSLGDDLTGDGFTPEHFIPSKIVVVQSLPDLEKGKNLL